MASIFLSVSLGAGALGGVDEVKIGEAADVFFSTVLAVETPEEVFPGATADAPAVAAVVATLLGLDNEGVVAGTGFVAAVGIGFAALTGVVAAAAAAAVVAVATRALKINIVITVIIVQSL